MKIKILLVDDHAILIDGLESLLKENPNLCVCAKSQSADFALANLKRETFDMMITDYSMPDMDGAALVKKAKQMHPDLKIIMLSMHDDPQIVREIMATGVDAYVLKKYAQQELLHAIDSVLNHRQYWSQEVSRALFHKPEFPDEQCAPTERELEVLKLLMQELTSREIADRLFISERTVETHRKNLMRKTNSVNTIGLIKYAYTHKLV